MDYDKLSCRDNDIYKEMDKFQTYELTTCITYEIATINKIIDEKLKRLDLLIQFEEEHQYLDLMKKRLGNIFYGWWKKLNR